MRNKNIFSKLAMLAVLLFASASLLACEDALNAFLMKKHLSRTEKRLEQKKKKDSALELGLLKPSFMFSDDDKYYKNYMLLKEEFFLLDRYKYISASSASNFIIDGDSNFIVYDKASGSLLFFNRYGVLNDRVKLNFGAESRILAPSNMLRDANGNIMMACSILGRFYRFTPGGTLLNSTEITENEGSYLKQMFAIKVFSSAKYTILAEMNSRKLFVYENGKKLFDLKYENLSDDAYIYFSPQNDIFLVDGQSSTILNVIPAADADAGKVHKYSLKSYGGDKILKSSAGQLFIYKKNERIIEKLNETGKVISSYGAVKSENITFENNLFPCDFALGPDDSLYVLDDKHYKINVYSSNGVFSFSFGSYGKSQGRFLAPEKILVDRLKRIIVCDRDKNAALVFNSRGEFVESYGNILGTNRLPHYGLYADLHEKIHLFDHPANQHYTLNYNFQFLKALNDTLAVKTNYPHSFITVGHAAGINFFDLNAQKCYELSPDAKLRRVDIPLEISSIKIEARKVFVKSLAGDGYGNVLALCKNEPFVYKLDVTGRTLKKFRLPEKGDAYSSIAADMFKNFYLTPARGDKILKFDENGAPKGAFQTSEAGGKTGGSISLLNFNRSNAAFACDRQRGVISIFRTLDGFTLDSTYELAMEIKKPGLAILDAAADSESIFVICSAGGELLMLKYKLADYFKDGADLFARGLYQEALVSFEKHRRTAPDPGPNALFYMAQCLRKLSKNYEAALIEAELTKKYPQSHAAERVR